MVRIGKKIEFDEAWASSLSEAEFLKALKNGASENVLKKAYKELPKTKKGKVKPKEEDGSGRLSSSGESK